VRHLRSITSDIRAITQADGTEQYAWAKELRAPVELVREIHETGRLPVPLFCAGGIATPADAALAMQLGAEAVFVGSGIFKSTDPPRFGRAIVEAVRHMRQITGEIKRLATLGEDELATAAKELAAPLDLVREVARAGRLPVVLFCAGGIATPADAALMMALGAEGVFVGSGIFKSDDPPTRARAIVEATTHWQDPERVAQASRGLGPAMVSLESSKLEGDQLLAQRGW